MQSPDHPRGFLACSAPFVSGIYPFYVTSRRHIRSTARKRRASAQAKRGTDGVIATRLHK